MGFRLGLTSVVVVLLALPAGAGAVTTRCANVDLDASSASIAKVEAAVACLVNDERAARKLNKLKRDSKLGRAARGHSKDMVKRDYFEHRSPSGKNAGDRIAAEGYRASFWGENIFLGLPTAAQVMSGWMASKGHCRIILSSDALDIGVGAALGRSPNWTQVLARKSSSNTPSGSESPARGCPYRGRVYTGR